MRIPSRRLLLGLGVALGAVIALWPVAVVTVRAAGPERVLWSRPIRGLVPIRLEYVHSVERTPVVEVYEASRRGLRLVRMEFVSQGAGLPSAGYVREGGRFVLRTDRALTTLPLRVSAMAHPRLVIGGSVLDLVALAGDGGSVVVAVRTRPRLLLLWGMIY